MATAAPSFSPPADLFEPAPTPTATAIFLAVVSGLLYGAAFPAPNFSALSWICLVPLLVLRPARPRRAFLYGWTAGFIANLIIFSWLISTFSVAHINPLTTFSAWPALAAVLGLYFGAFATLYHAVPDVPLRPWMGGAIWVGLEYIRSKILTGFPWALFGHTQYRNTPLVQTAALTGVEGISFLLVVFNGLVASLAVHVTRERALWRRPGPWKIDVRERRSRLFSRPRIANLAAGFGLILVLNVWGVWRLTQAPKAVDRTLRVAVLQGNIDQYQKWDDRYEAGVRSSYESLLWKAVPDKPDLVVWPESAVPGWIPNDRRYVEWLNRLAVRANLPQIVGAISSVGGRDMNSAFVLDPRGELVDVYNKEKLVPFGEYVPFGGFLKRWIPYIGQVGVFYPGINNHLFNLKNVRIAVNICYEAIFSGLVRRDVLQGADLIVNITNDGWFLKTAAPEQHYLVNIFRAVENGRSVVRAANTGISAVIDPFGRPLQRTPLLEQELLVEDVPIARSDFRTLYSRWGGWFVGFCWLLIAGSLYVVRVRPAALPPSDEEAV